MNTRRIIKWSLTVLILGIVVFVFMMLPRSRSLPEGYIYTYFPAGGHRYIIAPGGIKKVGQEVLDYDVSGTTITGRVRLQLEHDDIRSFSLDLRTHQVILTDRVQSESH